MMRIVLISVIVTALLVGGGVYWRQRISAENEKDSLQQANEELQQQINALQSQVVQLQQVQQANEELQHQISDLQSQVVQLQQAAEASTQISRKPKPGWGEYFPTASTTTLMNKSLSEMRELLGVPPVLVRVTAVVPENDRELWIYYVADDAPTGLYIYFKGGKVVKSSLDEFNGLDVVSYSVYGE